MGLDIRIPSDQYLIPWVDIDRNGSRYTVPSKQELLIGTVTNQPATLGRYFFTAAYLMVDLDANEFTLWQAKPTSDSRLVSRTNPGCGGTTPQSTAVSPRISKGSIAGIAVGVISGLGILDLVIFFYLRRIYRGSRGDQTAAELPGPNRLSELPVLVDVKVSSSPENELRGSSGVMSEPQSTYEMDGSTLREG